jgi:hypothetical protein
MDRWMDVWCEGFEELGVVDWKTKAQEQDGWRKFLQLAKIRERL